MQARVGEVRGGAVDARMASRSVGGDGCHAVTLEQGDPLLGLEARMPHLDGMAEGRVDAHGERRAPRHPLVVARSERRGIRPGSRQPREEGIEERRVEPQRRRQLPQERPELRAQVEHSRGEEVRERRLDVVEPLDVRDETRALDREDEAVGRAVAPPVPVRGLLQ